MRLPATQVALLEAASATETRTVESLADELDADPAAVTGAAFDLEAEDLVEVAEHAAQEIELTDEGADYREGGLPELRLYRAAVDAGAEDEPVGIGELVGAAGLEGPTVDIALSNFARKGFGDIDEGAVRVDLEGGPDVDPDDDPGAGALDAIAAGNAGYLDGNVLDRLVERGLATRSETTVRSVTLTDEGVTALMEGVETAETVGALTPELLTSGEWADVEFAEYNVEADAETEYGGRKHVLRQTADRVKDVLVGMGFQEMEGPHADAEFWINDCLFMPQDHPARTHWDQFALDVPPMRDLPADLVERVESAHQEGVGEDGEGYRSPWDEAFARALALRGH
ncbi:phenylalanine--tRNA ligase subunit alpha, partial [Halobacteriales archaeon QS_4_70_19]